ncbi:alpha/beta fold hydrolase [Spirillospora sp. NPDC047279]|uniref:alpha/beta fold hydrolase n=1 Tax=Spirillospora sp. NPDC047279 TaxID=3155478 RepID=UPI0033D06B9D
MTTAAATVAPVESRAVDVDGIPMSALFQEAHDPRGVIVALHGGAASPVYFDAPGHPRLSLLRTAAALGYTAIALDRPGYGRSAGHAAGMAPVARRVELAYAAVDRLLDGRSRGAGLFVVGHSMGCALAVHMAAAERGRELLGLEIAGTGRQMQPRAAEIIGSRHNGGDSALSAGPSLRDILWRPARLYPADLDPGLLASPAPSYEKASSVRWGRELPDVAARVRVPVRYSLGDHERCWNAGPPALAEVAALFTASPRVRVHEQADAGHNLSVGLSALAYHLTVVSFAEECALERNR